MDPNVTDGEGLFSAMAAGDTEVTALPILLQFSCLRCERMDLSMHIRKDSGGLGSNCSLLRHRSCGTDAALRPWLWLMCL
jgi:hypothetical protein